MRALYVPERFAHGYQALQDNTDTSYQVGEFYAPELRGRTDATTIRGSAWPGRCRCRSISDKDQAFRPLVEVEGELKRRMSPAMAD